MGDYVHILEHIGHFIFSHYFTLIFSFFKRGAGFDAAFIGMHIDDNLKSVPQVVEQEILILSRVADLRSL